MQHNEIPVPPEACMQMISAAWELLSVSLSFFTIVFNMDIEVPTVIFSTDGGSSVKNIKYMCPGLLCSVCGLISPYSWLFLWFLVFGLVQVLCLSPVLTF